MGLIGYNIDNLFFSKTFIIKELKKETKVTLNRGGLTFDEIDTPKVQKGIRKWEEIREERAPEDSEDISYWKNMSNCSAL